LQKKEEDKDKINQKNQKKTKTNDLKNIKVSIDHQQKQTAPFFSITSSSCIVIYILIPILNHNKVDCLTLFVNFFF